MSLDDIKFDNDEDRRRYLSELSRLKRIREEQKKRENPNDKDRLELPLSKRRVNNDNIELEIPKKVEKVRLRRVDIEDRDTRKRKEDIEQVSSKSFEEIKFSKTRKRKKKKRNKFLILFRLLLLLIISSLVFLAYLFLNKKDTGFYTLAIFGVDSRDGNLKEGALADVNLIANINRETGEIKLVSLYRDTYTEIDGKGTYHKLNEAYFKGGPKQAIETLNRNFDLSIDDYASFNWKTVIEVVNALGGVDIDISESEFKYINSFITETVESTGIGSHHLKETGLQHLDGVQALAYARLRLMDTDYKRTKRQRKLISLLFEKAKNADINTLKNLATIIIPQISTTVGLNDIVPLLRNFNKYYLSDTTGFPFERENKKMKRRDFVIPLSLEKNVEALHYFLYGEEKKYSPSTKVKAISKEIKRISGLDLVKDEVSIQVEDLKE